MNVTTNHLEIYSGYFCVYRIDIGSWYYYGRTRHAKKRYGQHLWRLKNDRHENRIMQNAYNKYGRLSMTVICAITQEKDIVDTEQKFLNAVFEQEGCRCMNIAKRADAVKTGPMTEAHKRKIGDKSRGRRYSKEHKKRMSESRKGSVSSQATKDKISIAMKGRYAGSKNPMFGTKSPAAKRIITITPDGKTKTHESIRAAALFLDVPITTLHTWLMKRSPFPGKGGRKIELKYQRLIGLHAYYADCD